MAGFLFEDQSINKPSHNSDFDRGLWMDGKMGTWGTDERMNGTISRWMGGWREGWIDEWIGGWVGV